LERKKSGLYSTQHKDGARGLSLPRTDKSSYAEMNFGPGKELVEKREGEQTTKESSWRNSLKSPSGSMQEAAPFPSMLAQGS